LSIYYNWLVYQLYYLYFNNIKLTNGQPTRKEEKEEDNIKSIKSRIETHRKIINGLSTKVRYHPLFSLSITCISAI
jgi:hypothetical protein